jgi:hypothetical protein
MDTSIPLYLLRSEKKDRSIPWDLEDLLPNIDSAIAALFKCSLGVWSKPWAFNSMIFSSLQAIISALVLESEFKSLGQKWIDRLTD